MLVICIGNCMDASKIWGGGMHVTGKSREGEAECYVVFELL